MSINEIHNNTNLIVHPNPFSVETTIFLNEQFENVQLVICNSSGQIVMQQLDFSSQTITVPRNNLMSGLYFAYLTTENNQTTVFKLIITD
ncbi:MAG: T9SS type A sorting domain-containing protein [Crocinitomicaceae bacterium]|nr:T9SS type A sorting domain-containing protein [Crocinitomicaceae bacterium]